MGAQRSINDVSIYMSNYNVDQTRCVWSVALLTSLHLRPRDPTLCKMWFESVNLSDRQSITWTEIRKADCRIHDEKARRSAPRMVYAATGKNVESLSEQSLSRLMESVNIKGATF